MKRNEKKIIIRNIAYRLKDQEITDVVEIYRREMKLVKEANKKKNVVI